MECVTITPDTIYKIVVTVLLCISEIMALVGGNRTPNGIIQGLITGTGNILLPGVRDQITQTSIASSLLAQNSPSVDIPTQPEFILQSPPVPKTPLISRNVDPTPTASGSVLPASPPATPFGFQHR